MAPLWTAADAAAATGGRARGDWAVTGVSIDTRSLAAGDLFVALSDARDGHDFVAEALGKGAAAAMVSRIPEGVRANAPLLIVEDTLAGLTALGRAGRARAAARVIAVTGSVGKTSAKEMLRTMLGACGTVQAAEASYNNHWGVPLTLARLDPAAEFAVIEIGMNHPGEIGPLARLARPHVALVTTIAPAHLAAFDDLAAIAREKAAIFDGLEPGGIGVVNADLDTTALLEGAAPRVRLFGATARADFRLIGAQLSGDVTIVEAEADGAPLLFKIGAPGRHFAMNALGCLAAAQAAGADTARAALALAGWQPPGGRGRREYLRLDPVEDAGFELIDDAYNANPASVGAALEVLAAAAPRNGVGRVGRGRRIAILGDMLELGPDEAALHAALADHPAMAEIDIVHCIGARMAHLWHALAQAKRGDCVETPEALCADVKRLVDAGDVVLVKGSKASGAVRVVDALRKLRQSIASDPRGTD